MQATKHSAGHSANRSTSQQFSFRESKRVETAIKPFLRGPRPHDEIVKMRTILNATRRKKNTCGDIRVNHSAASLSIKLFERMIARRLWYYGVVFSPPRNSATGEVRKPWLNGFAVNYDQQDLLIIARRVARRIVERKKLGK